MIRVRVTTVPVVVLPAPLAGHRPLLAGAVLVLARQAATLVLAGAVRIRVALAAIRVRLVVVIPAGEAPVLTGDKLCTFLLF